MNDAGTWRLGHRPALDGLRGVAILLVLACHLPSVMLGANDQYHALGSAGVEVFFALSGFLITALLLQERAATGGVSLLRFYGRRARRLFPALAVVVAFVLSVQAIVGQTLAPNVWPVIGYVANWSQVGGANLGVLNHTWSLAIEEQFYLVWPVALLAVAWWRNGPIVLAGVGIMASTVLRLTLSDGGRVYFGSDTQAGALLAGALLAILALGGLPAWRVRPIVPALLVAAPAAFALTEPRWVGDRLVPTLVPVLAAAAIWMACSVPGGPLAWPWLQYVGRRSYAVYLWHLPLLWLAWLVDASLLSGAIAVALSFLAAELSWRLVEGPVLTHGHSPAMATAPDTMVPDVPVVTT